MILLSAVMIYVGPLAPFALAQFQWSQRIASAGSLPEGELTTGLTLDTNANCYVTGWFDGTNNFGGITLTNHSTGGGSDIFVAKYNSSGTLQWVQPAGQSAGNVNYGRAVGADTNGNIYVTGGYGLGVRSNSFGFTISWATNISVVVQACTNLANPVWTPLATNPLVGGTNYFSDPEWTNYPRRFYRITTP